MKEHGSVGPVWGTQLTQMVPRKVAACSLNRLQAASNCLKVKDFVDSSTAVAAVFVLNQASWMLAGFLFVFFFFALMESVSFQIMRVDVLQLDELNC